MPTAEHNHLRAIAQALLVTFLWSTSWVLIKIGLDEIQPLTFAGLRYVLAAAVLALVASFSPRHRAALRRLSPRAWRQLVVLGLVFFTLTQGALFLSLSYLPAMILSLILSFSPAAVALLAVPLLGERPTRLQWIGIFTFLLGAIVFFSPFTVSLRAAGLLAAGLTLLANALGSIMGRDVNRRRDIDPLIVTVVSMGAGAIVLLFAGLLIEGAALLGAADWAVVVWLAVVNTAFAFTLWNRTLQQLSAVESSIINNTMLVQIALLAWLFLDEPLGWREVLGIVVATLGALLTQVRRGAPAGPPGIDD